MTNEIIDTDEIEESSGLTETVELKLIGFLAGINSGFAAATLGGEQQVEILTTFVFVALGIRASPGPGRLKNVKKAPNAAMVGLGIGYGVGFILKNPDRVVDSIPQ